MRLAVSGIKPCHNLTDWKRIVGREWTGCIVEGVPTIDFARWIFPMKQQYFTVQLLTILIRHCLNMQKTWERVWAPCLYVCDFLIYFNVYADITLHNIQNFRSADKKIKMLCSIHRVDSVSFYRRVIRNIWTYRFNTQDIQSNHFWLIKIDRFIHSPAWPCWAEQALFTFGQWLIVCVTEFIRNKFRSHCVSSVCATCLYSMCHITASNWRACHNSPPPARKIVPNAQILI